MARQFSLPGPIAEDMITRVQRLFADPSLIAFRSYFEEWIRHQINAIEFNHPNELGQIDRLIKEYEQLIHHQPSNRFHVDAWIIGDLTNSWGNGVVKLPGNILPLYGSKWNWRILPWPRNKDEASHLTYGITFPGGDMLSDVNLLKYPWLCHELGHGLFHKAPKDLQQNFSDEVQAICRTHQRKAFADSPEVKAKSNYITDRFKEVWQPLQTQRSWPHEIAVDSVALWVCGPAFIAAMLDEVDSDRLDPFEINTVHPPYALRIGVLCRLAKELGWENESAGLSGVMTKWQMRAKKMSHYNLYSALVDNKLGFAAALWARDGCLNWKLPKCTRNQIHEVDEIRRSGQAPKTAVELIIAAWLAFDNSRETYGRWQSETVQQLSQDLNGNA